MDEETTVPEETVTLEVPAETLEAHEDAATAEAQQRAETALAVADNAGELAASASYDVAKLEDEVDELETTWQETAAQIGVVVAGLQTTVMQLPPLLTGIVEMQQAQAAVLQTILANQETLSIRLSSADQAPKPAEMPNPGEGEAVPEAAATNPVEAVPAPENAPSKPAPRRRTL